MDELIDKSRLPIDEVHVFRGKFEKCLYPGTNS